MNVEQQQIDAAVQHGDYAGAEQIIEHVLQQHPNSAKAHYIHAEILVRLDRLAEAQHETRVAKKLDPQIHFTSAENFGKFEARLAIATHQHSTAGNPVQSVVPVSSTPDNQSLPVAPIIGGVVVLILLAMLIARLFSRRAVANYSGYPVGNGSPYPPNGGAPVFNPPSSGAGTAVAAGLGGLAAGMMLERALDGSRSEVIREVPVDGAMAPGLEDDDARQQLDSAPFDMGNDDSSWDDSASGGGFDSGNDNGW
jgi:tetratricopeptide (TPR) repeat protein